MQASRRRDVEHSDNMIPDRAQSDTTGGNNTIDADLQQQSGGESGEPA